MLDYSNLTAVISLQPLLNILSKLNQAYSLKLLYCMPTKYTIKLSCKCTIGNIPLISILSAIVLTIRDAIMNPLKINKTAYVRMKKGKTRQPIQACPPEVVTHLEICISFSKMKQMALRLQPVKLVNTCTVLEKYKVLSFNKKRCLPITLNQNAWINVAIFKEAPKCWPCLYSSIVLPHAEYFSWKLNLFNLFDNPS